MNRIYKTLKEEKGFTLIEIIVVIIIIGLLAAIAVPAVSSLLVKFRKDYYKELEESITLTGKSYMSDHRNLRPKNNLYSRVVKMSTLEEEKLISEVKDYTGKKCDNTDTSYSYFIAIKTADKKYEYATCLKCSNDGYETDPTKEKYCNEAWLTNGNISIEPNIPTTTAYIHVNSTLSEVQDILKTDEVKIIKKDATGKIIGEYTTTSNDYVYPLNAEEFVSSTPKDGIANYKFTDKEGNEATGSRPVKVFEYLPLTITAKRNGSSEIYPIDGSKWANRVTVVLSLGDSILTDLNLKIEKWQYFDQVQGRWLDIPSCTSGTTKCTIDYINEQQTITKYRYIDSKGNISKETSEVKINIDKTNPTCTLTYSGKAGLNGWLTGKAMIDFASTGDQGGSKIAKKGVTTSTTPDYSTNKGTQSDTPSTGTKWYGYVEDAAGNMGKCEKLIKVDTIAPQINATFKITPKESGYNSLNVNLSGIVATDVNLDKMRISNSTTFSAAPIAYKQTYANWTLDGSYDGKTRNVYVKVIDKAGNESALSKGTYNPYSLCSQTTVKWDTPSACSKACGTGTQTVTGVKYDKYITTTSCGTASKKQDCNTQSCCSSTTVKCNAYGAWGNCSKSCGSGTRKRTRTCGNYSTYDGSYCSANTNTSNTTQTESCNTQSCCSSTTVKCGAFGAWGSCSKSCGSGTKSRTRTCGNYSTYDGSYCSANTSSSNTTETQSCNTQTCCSSTYVSCGEYGAWGSCSKSCDSGTQSATRWCGNYSSYDGSYCSQQTSSSYTTKSQSCNTHSCAPTITCSWSGNTGIFSTTNGKNGHWYYYKVGSYTSGTWDKNKSTTSYKTGYGDIKSIDARQWKLERSSYVPLTGQSRDSGSGLVSNKCNLSK